MGINRQWKQNSNLGKQNNQKFVQIPFYKLQSYLSYLAEWNGIRIVEQEESYTSKSSFLDNDPIPVYGETKDKPSFSGKRRPTRYTRSWQENGLWISKQYYKKDGFRGLYATKMGLSSILIWMAAQTSEGKPSLTCSIGIKMFGWIKLKYIIILMLRILLKTRKSKSLVLKM